MSFETSLSEWLGGSFYPLKMYFRDTDAPINVKKIYKRGRVFRTDRVLQVTENYEPNNLTSTPNLSMTEDERRIADYWNVFRPDKPDVWTEEGMGY